MSIDYWKRNQNALTWQNKAESSVVWYALTTVHKQAAPVTLTNINLIFCYICIVHKQPQTDTVWYTDALEWYWDGRLHGVKNRRDSFKCLPLVTVKWFLGYFQNSVHSYDVRRNMDLFIPRCKRKIGQRVSVYKSSVLWNKLPVELKMCSSLLLFTRKLKLHLLTRMLK